MDLRGRRGGQQIRNNHPRKTTPEIIKDWKLCLVIRPPLLSMTRINLPASFMLAIQGNTDGCILN